MKSTILKTGLRMAGIFLLMVSSASMGRAATEVVISGLGAPEYQCWCLASNSGSKPVEVPKLIWFTVPDVEEIVSARTVCKEYERRAIAHTLKQDTVDHVGDDVYHCMINVY